MLIPRLPEDHKEVAVAPQPLRVVASDDAESTLEIVLPPLDDVAEIRELALSAFSISEHVKAQAFTDTELIEAELAALMKKSQEFPKSPRLYAKLAELASIAKKHDLELDFSRAAVEYGKSSFFSVKLGESLSRHGLFDEAEKVFSAAAEANDLNAMLRVAAFHVRRANFVGAEALVSKAAQIDSLDYSVRLFEGALHLLAGRFVEAVRSNRLALQERPASSVAHSNMAIAYLGLNDEQKALTSLKKAAALDPLSSRPVALLADLAFKLHKVEDSVASLRYYLSFEQTDAAMWSRLARAAFVLSCPEESLAALKRQAGLEDSGAVWNNMGVAYSAAGNSKKSYACFVHAMKLESAAPTKSYFLAAKNLARLVTAAQDYDALYGFCSEVAVKDRGGILLRDRQLADLVILQIISLIKRGRDQQAEQAVVDLLAKDNLSDSLAVWLVSALAAMRSLAGLAIDPEEMLRIYGGRAAALRTVDESNYVRFFNNIAFALAELGRVREAESVLTRIGHHIHVAPYPTATHGLIQFRKGLFDKASALYDKAVALASSRDDKLVIRQKFNLEAGRYWMEASNESRARRFLLKAKQSDAEPRLSKKASEMLRVVAKRSSQGT